MLTYLEEWVAMSLVFVKCSVVSVVLEAFMHHRRTRQ